MAVIEIDYRYNIELIRLNDIIVWSDVITIQHNNNIFLAMCAITRFLVHFLAHYVEIQTKKLRK